MIVYLAQDYPAFVMYCIYMYGASRSSLLIESTDSMIVYAQKAIISMLGISECTNAWKLLDLHT